MRYRRHRSKLERFLWSNVGFWIQRLLVKIISLVYKPRLTGTWKDICKEVKRFSKEHPAMVDMQGALIRYIGVDGSYTTYYFTAENRGHLMLRKFNNCFYELGDCGQLEADIGIYELIELCDNRWINYKAFKAKYRVGIPPKPQHKYY